jgi:hypothetical protein
MPNRFFDNLKREAEENPMAAMGIAAALIAATTKFMDSQSWRAEVKRREKKDKKDARKKR